MHGMFYLMLHPFAARRGLAPFGRCYGETSVQLSLSVVNLDVQVCGTHELIFSTANRKEEEDVSLQRE